MNNPRATHESEPSRLLHVAVYKALMTGMIVSSLLFAAAILSAIVSGKPMRLDSGWPPELHGLSGIWLGIRTADPVLLSVAGVVILILTPISRIFASIAAFTVSRDFKFVAITVFVAMAVALAIFLGVTGVLR
jgi:uncharacterized membrane protein